MRSSSFVKLAALAASLAVLALVATAGGAQAFDVGGGGGTNQGQSFQFVFESFSTCLGDIDCPPGGPGQSTAFVGGEQYPPGPIFPPNPCRKIAEGTLYLPGSDDAFAVGLVFSTDPILGGYLFDGHLLPAVVQPPQFPTDPVRFLGKLFPPSPCASG